jgi:hypothetical protein
MESIILNLQRLPPGTVIPQPEAQAHFTIKGWGNRGGLPALICSSPNRAHPAQPHESGINTVEWKQAYQQLLDTGAFTKKWYAHHMPRCSTESRRSFATIGGLFSLIGLAKYESKGVYRSIVLKSA